MELKITPFALPKAIGFNFDELKAEIKEKADLYKNMVYTDDTIREAKADKAKLNKFITALEDKRKWMKKQCLQPYEDFEKQIKELVAIVNEPVLLIDTQVKAYEEKQKEEKLEKINGFWESIEHPDWLTCKQIFDVKWLNATFSMKKVQEAIEERLNQVVADVKTIESLPEFTFEAMETYKQTIDLNRAIAEGQRLADIQRRKAEDEAARLKATTEVVETKISSAPGLVQVEDVPVKQWIKFAALLSLEDAAALKAWFRNNGIIYRAV